MSPQRDLDDPERIGPVPHPDDCDCDTCRPPHCPVCGVFLQYPIALGCECGWSLGGFERIKAGFERWLQRDP